MIIITNTISIAIITIAIILSLLLISAWTECANKYPQSVGCREQIWLEHLTPKIQLSTLAAKSENLIVGTMTMRHCKVSEWWVQ
jgi:hypothetical protein